MDSPAVIGAQRDLPPLTGRGEFRRGWPVLVVATLGSAFGMAGLSLYCLPLFMGEFREAFGWTPSEIGLAATFHTLGMFVAGPVVGRLCDRLGYRRVIPVSAVLYAAVLAALTLIGGSVKTLYAGYFALALLGNGTSYACYARAISTWFDRSRGLALGIAMSGPGLVAAIAPLTLSLVIARWGWQDGWLTLAALAILPCPLAILFLKEPVSEAPPGAVIELEGLSLRQAAMTPHFRKMMIGVVLITTAISATQIHLIPMLVETGMSEPAARGLASSYGAIMIIGRVGAGFLLDRLRTSLLVGVFFLASGIGVSIFLLGGKVAAPAIVLGIGIAAGSEGDVCAYLTGRYFGLRNFTEIFTWLFCAMGVGSALGPIMAGSLHSLTGGYMAGLVATALSCAAAGLCFATLGNFTYTAGRS